MLKQFCAALLLLVWCVPAIAAPHVLATIKPIHSLVAGVMEGVAKPDLLIGGALSEHSYALKPSDARKIEHASVIFEVGQDLETYLMGPLAALGGHSNIIALEQAPDVKLLVARRGGIWGNDHDEGPNDPHIWLDPQNAIAMTGAIADALERADPAHAGQYRVNAARQVAALTVLDRELAAKLAPIRNRPYIVFHDAYHYFESRYGLKPAGAVTVAPDRPVGPRRITQLRSTIVSGHVACIFREPQFPPKLIESLGEGTKVRIGVLDPLGAELMPGPRLYPDLLRGLARSLTGCLGKNR
ncbi:MAG: zinc ABC transporter substrate-binding protein [Rhizomicrobium sp.]